MATQYGKRIDLDKPVNWLVQPFREFARLEASGGIVLIAATVVALIWANSPWAETYHDLWHTYVTVGFGAFAIKESLAHWVNDGLMAVFFFVVGLEIKRETLLGELASVRKAAVPVVAAAGGMLVPAAVYAALNVGRETMSGWAIPAATDIAFALGVLALLGDRVPIALKVFLTALAIVDDIGAVLIIGVFYTAELSLPALGVAACVVVVLVGLNVMGVRRPTPYALLGIVLWVAFLQSGVHATVAGVVLAMTIPARRRVADEKFAEFTLQALERFRTLTRQGAEAHRNPEMRGLVDAIEDACEKVQMPLHRLEEKLHPWVAFFIMPVFALANAGLAIGAESLPALSSRVGLGVLLGLLLGKQLGVGLFTWLVIRTGFGRLPSGTTPRQVYGASVLAGIGFTMSLFIANLAFESPAHLEAAKIGILCASLLAGVAGYAILRPRATTAAGPHPTS